LVVSLIPAKLFGNRIISRRWLEGVRLYRQADSGTLIWTEFTNRHVTITARRARNINPNSHPN
jgi:hypothetical protein